MCCGSEFHRVGAPTLKDLSAKVLHLVLGTLSCKCVSLDVDECRPGLVVCYVVEAQLGMLVLDHAGTYK